MDVKILIGLFICHWLADYTHLSRPFMLNAKRFGEPLMPILYHACVHGLLMVVYLSFFVNDVVMLKLFMFQVVTHFLIDVWKGKMNSWFPTLQSPANKWHWIVFGFDQLLHALVIIIMYAYTYK